MDLKQDFLLNSIHMAVKFELPSFLELNRFLKLYWNLSITLFFESCDSKLQLERVAKQATDLILFSFYIELIIPPVIRHMLSFSTSAKKNN